MSGLWQDLRLALRRLKAAPGFAVVATAILALGIGANTAIFSVVDGVLIRALPYPDADRLASIGMENFKAASTISFRTFADWRERSRSLESAAAYNYSWTPALLDDAGRAELLAGRQVTHDFFRVLGVQPAVGRDFRPEDDRDGAPEVAILSHGLWQAKFGGEPALVGQTIRLNERPYTVIGILPQGFRAVGFASLGRPVEIWSALRYEGSKDGECRDCNHLSGIVRIRSGVSPLEAREELDRIQHGLDQEFPGKYRADDAANLTPFQDRLVGNVRPALYSLTGAVSFVLLICCANLANLFLIRGTERRREIATRVALGASRLRIARQLLTENLLIAGVGGAGGLLVSAWLTPALLAMAPTEVSRLVAVGLNWRVLVFGVGLSLFTGIAFGVMPALGASRVRIQDALKLGGQGARGVTAGGPRSVLGAAEVALALVLVSAAGLLLRSFSTLLGVDPGLDPRNVLTVVAPPSGEKYRQPAVRERFYADVAEQVRALPGVTAAAWATNLPLGGGFDRRGLCIQERVGCPSPADPSADSYVVTPGYFQVMRIPLLRGRVFNEDDRDGHEPVAVVGETLAAQQWPGEEAIGRKIRVSGFGDSWRTVIGVVGDVRHFGLDSTPMMEAYVPRPQTDIGWGFLAVRSSGPPATVTGAIREVIAGVDPAVPIFEMKTMEQYIADSVSERRFALLLISSFAGVALLLAALGLYGVLAYAVSRRTQEIGIRVALGAMRRDILRLVFAQASKMVVVGLVAGIAAALAVARVLASQLFGVGPSDPLTFGVVVLTLVLVAAAACYIPARRAMRVDPLTALRYE